VLLINSDGKVAVVTSASRGIGLAVVKALAESGAKVMASVRQPTDALTELAATYDVYPVIANAGTVEGAQRFVQETIERLGRLDILVNNIGATDTSAGGGFLQLSDAD
jgi:NAD(P)-dependent dehydrogenase (short-subunit alcohol dehydrogenase family)